MARYTPPTTVLEFDAMDVVARVRPLATTQASMFRANSTLDLYYAGNLALVERPVVAVVGTREMTADGARRARRIGRELSDADIVVMSGLARGIDAEAMTAVAKHPQGKLIGVIATAPEVAVPKANAGLQELVHTEHLLVTEYQQGTPTQRHHFPARNKIMALLSDATIIVEAAETSGTIHQAAECRRLGRHLFFLRSMVDQGFRWVDQFLAEYDRAYVLDSTSELVDILSSSTAPQI